VDCLSEAIEGQWPFDFEGASAPLGSIHKSESRPARHRFHFFPNGSEVAWARALFIVSDSRSRRGDIHPERLNGVFAPIEEMRQTVEHFVQFLVTLRISFLCEIHE